VGRWNAWLCCGVRRIENAKGRRGTITYIDRMSCSVTGNRDVDSTGVQNIRISHRYFPDLFITNLNYLSGMWLVYISKEVTSRNCDQDPAMSLCGLVVHHCARNHMVIHRLFILAAFEYLKVR